MTLSFLALSSPQLAAQQARSELARFQHDEHSTFVCDDCHGSGQATTAANRQWCAGCHHVEVGLSGCDRCHVPAELTPEPLRQLVTFRLSVVEPTTRSLTFDHDLHGEVECADCHTGGAELLVRQECTACHVEHHQRGVECTACHAEPTTTAHPPEVHRDLAGCGAAGCHVSEGLDYAGLVDERNLCISCHVAQREHEPAQPCADCHILSGDPGPGTGRDP
ncbi:MAG: hypothetical protein OEU54_09970 [Gemmatimonadota bacterium]|nr:hypothetical protein [Gemmatimonadota bacterium]